MKHLSILFAAVLAACGGGDSQTAAAEAPSPSPVEAPSSPPEPSPSPAPVPILEPVPSPSPSPTPIPAPEPAPVEWIKTNGAAFSPCEQQWGFHPDTGPASHAVDGNEKTSWSCFGPATITFDLGWERLISGVEVSIFGLTGGHGLVNVYVDDVLVLSSIEPTGFGRREVFSFTPTIGRFIKYESTPWPADAPGKFSTGWTELSEFLAIVEKQ